MFPLLILVCLRLAPILFYGLLDDCALAFLGILVVVVLREIVIVVTTTVRVVVVVVRVSSSTAAGVVAFAIIAITVIPIVGIVLVVGIATVSVLLGVPVLVCSLISVAVPYVLTRCGVASKLRLTTLSLWTTTIWRDIDV